MSSDQGQGDQQYRHQQQQQPRSTTTPQSQEEENPENRRIEASSTFATPPQTGSALTPQSQQSSSTAPTTSLGEEEDKKPAAATESETPTYPSTPERPRPRQVIAVSASKGPAAFFNLARKFLVTDEMCDLSALEGAIVSAADAAHLLERSKLATIVRYVLVWLLFWGTSSI